MQHDSPAYREACDTLTRLQRRVLRAVQLETTVEGIAKKAKLDEATTRNVLIWLQWKGLVVREQKWRPTDAVPTVIGQSE